MLLKLQSVMRASLVLLSDTEPPAFEAVVPEKLQRVTTTVWLIAPA